MTRPPEADTDVFAALRRVLWNFEQKGDEPIKCSDVADILRQSLGVFAREETDPINRNVVKNMGSRPMATRLAEALKRMSPERSRALALQCLEDAERAFSEPGFVSRADPRVYRSKNWHPPLPAEDGEAGDS